MTRVVGVRFRTAGKIYFFDPVEFDIKRGDNVIVETARGVEFGTAVSDIYEVEDEKVVQPLKSVMRIATQRDKEQELANKDKEKEAFQICLEKIRKHELEMKLIDAEYTFDNNKVLFYFTADGRIDFRDLVKDLASVFKTRIELRQIGVRDETKIRGGIGICGRPLCCHSYLSDFIPVSIKMAKEQNLSLNPTKISGVCGRLMCCLKNEEETYEDLNRRLPGIGDFVTTDDGLKGEVASVNVLRQLVKVIVDIEDEKEIREYEVGKLQFKKKHGKKEKLELSKEEMQELERLEKEEAKECVEEAKPHDNKRRDFKNKKAEDSVKDAVKEGSKEGPRDSRRESTREAQRDTQRESTREAQRDTQRESTREAQRDTQRESTREAQRDTQRDNSREAQKDTSGASKEMNKNGDKAESGEQTGAGRKKPYNRYRHHDKKKHKPHQEGTAHGGKE